MLKEIGTPSLKMNLQLFNEGEPTETTTETATETQTTGTEQETLEQTEPQRIKSSIITKSLNCLMMRRYSTFKKV